MANFKIHSYVTIQEIPGSLRTLPALQQRQRLERILHRCRVNYNKFTEWQRKQLWNEKLGCMEEKHFPTMSPVTLTDLPISTSEEMKDFPPIVPVIRYANLLLQDGTSVVVRNTTYEKMIHVFQKMIG